MRQLGNGTVGVSTRTVELVEYKLLILITIECGLFYPETKVHIFIRRELFHFMASPKFKATPVKRYKYGLLIIKRNIYTCLNCAWFDLVMCSGWHAHTLVRYLATLETLQ